MDRSIIENIRKGEIDINNQDLFFSILIKGLLLNLNDSIDIRNKSVPHFILHTGDDIMYLEKLGYNYSLEPSEISNENYIYNQIPRCLVNPASIDLVVDQLSNPYSWGTFQYDSGDQLMTLNAEFRRIPIKMSCELKYYVDSFTDSIAMMQQIITKLTFVRTFEIVYMGQSILCSYQIPTTLDSDRLMDIDGTTTDNKNKTISLSIEVETSFPVFENRTVVSSSDIITKLDYTGNLNHNLETISQRYKREEKNAVKISTGDIKLGSKGTVRTGGFDDVVKYNRTHEIS